MRMRTSAHTHTRYVDGKNTAEEMVLAALEKDFTALGFSEHSSQTIDAAYALDPAREEDYKKEILMLREKYAGRIRIWLGLERDAESVASREGYDYIIASSHYLTDAQGNFLAVDTDATSLRAWIERNYLGDGMEMARAYYRKFAKYVCAYQPDIIGHFDLLMKCNRQKALFDYDDPEYLRISRKAMEEMIPACDVMEVNTGGTARSGQPVPFPEARALAYWRSLGGRVIVTSDCHRAYQLDAWYDRAAAYLWDAGYREILELSPHEGALFETRKLTV